MLRQAEIHQLRARFRQHDVCRLEITVNNPQLVGLGERIGNLGCNADGLLRGQRSFDEAVVQRFPFDQFHDEEIHPILMTDIMQRADVRMSEFRNSLGFALQPLAQGRIRGQICRQNLDGYISPQPCVAGAIHLSHPARA